MHSTHIRITKIKQSARCYVFWKGINHDIEYLVKGCEECAELSKNHPKIIVHACMHAMIRKQIGNREHLHIDYAGPIEGHFF